MESNDLLNSFLSKFIVNDNKERIADNKERIADNKERIADNKEPIDNNIKSVNIVEDKTSCDTKVNSISKLDSDDKPYALKAFGATMGSYHYKKNIKKPMGENKNKKTKEVIVIEKLSDL